MSDCAENSKSQPSATEGGVCCGRYLGGEGTGTSSACTLTKWHCPLLPSGTVQRSAIEKNCLRYPSFSTLTLHVSLRSPTLFHAKRPCASEVRTTSSRKPGQRTRTVAPVTGCSVAAEL